MSYCDQRVCFITSRADRLDVKLICPSKEMNFHRKRQRCKVGAQGAAVVMVVVEEPGRTCGDGAGRAGRSA